MFNSEYIESEEQIDFRKCGYLLNGIAIMIHRDYQIIYRNVVNYTTIVMKNKTKLGENAKKSGKKGNEKKVRYFYVFNFKKEEIAQYLKLN